MEKRVTILESDVKNIREDISEMKEMLHRHDLACEVHAPQAKDAHDGMVSMSKEFGVMTEALKTVVNQIDDIQCRNEKADDKTDKILKELAELNGQKKVITWVATGLISFISVFMLWTANEIQKLQKTDIKHSSGIHKAIKKDNEEDEDR